jgi:hypothetical protein
MALMRWPGRRYSDASVVDRAARATVSIDARSGRLTGFKRCLVAHLATRDA